MDTARFLEGDTVWPDMCFFYSKIRASIAAGAFDRLHNHKYTKFQLCENCGLRAYIESLRTYKKFKISEWKVQFFKRLDL